MLGYAGVVDSMGAVAFTLNKGESSRGVLGRGVHGQPCLEGTSLSTD